jgi:adenine-specific DNA-methyltransferase
MVMDEIFGEQNFIANVVWQKKYTRSNDAKWFSDNHDHILVYGRDRELVALNNLPRTDSQLSAYSNPDNHPKGKWKATPLHAKSGNISSFSYTFKNGITWSPPLGTYPRYSKKTLKKLDDNNEIWFGKDGSATPSRKTFLSEAKEGVTPITIWTYDIAGHNHQANSELKKLGAGGLFTNPKPTLLVKLMLQLSTNAKKHDIVLDFFAGSCTTADAVMKLNTEDGGNRKFICAQIPESCDENSEPYKAGFKNIADVGKERIRRAGEKIKKGNEGKLDFDGDRLDLGFKVFRLDKSNFKIWRNDVEDENQLEKQMQMFVDNLRSGIVRENILYELILKSGLDLNVETERKKANGKEYYSIDDGKLIICLEDKITQNLMDKIRTAEPEKVICLDRAFKGNDQLKTNTILQMESEEIEFKVI